LAGSGVRVAGWRGGARLAGHGWRAREFVWHGCGGTVGGGSCGTVGGARLAGGVRVARLAVLAGVGGWRGWRARLAGTVGGTVGGHGWRARLAGHGWRARLAGTVGGHPHRQRCDGGPFAMRSVRGADPGRSPARHECLCWRPNGLACRRGRVWNIEGSTAIRTRRHRNGENLVAAVRHDLSPKQAQPFADRDRGIGVSAGVRGKRARNNLNAIALTPSSGAANGVSWAVPSAPGLRSIEYVWSRNRPGPARRPREVRVHVSEVQIHVDKQARSSAKVGQSVGDGCYWFNTRP